MPIITYIFMNLYCSLPIDHLLAVVSIIFIAFIIDFLLSLSYLLPSLLISYIFIHFYFTY